jgi:succinate dehydrogenase / fumarate reductase iron-sulfur subunit
MRNFKDGETLILEPFRGGSFKVIKDLVVDRSGLDRIMEKGGYISVNVGSAPDANSIPVPKTTAEEAFDFAACIGCGACIASCPNGSAMFFVAAKLAHLNRLPQGRPESARRLDRMLQQSLAEGFGACSNHGECELACPKKIPIKSIVEIYRSQIVLKGA